VEFFIVVPGGEALPGECWEAPRGGKGSNSINDHVPQSPAQSTELSRVSVHF
jgi:hypothetical protein